MRTEAKSSFWHDHTEQIITATFWLFVFIGLSIFFQKYHPLTIYDTDDWTYVKFTRRHGGVFPSTGEYNPIKVLPENMMAVAGFVGAYVVKPFCGDYVRSLEISCSMFFCLTITVYCLAIVAALGKMVKINSLKKMILAVFIIFVHFIPLVVNDTSNVHFFYEGNTTCIYNYTIPTFFNAIAICFSIVYEDILCELDFKNHRFLLVFFIGLVYLSINSNLFSNILIASYAFCKWLQYLLDIRKFVESMRKGRYCIFILIMWLGSLVFEYNGARASQVGHANLDVTGAVNQLFTNMKGMNKFYLVGLVCLLMISIMLCFRIKSNGYIKNMIPIFILGGCITTIFIILLSSKIDKIYISNPAVQLTYSFCFMMVGFIVITIIINHNKASFTAVTVVAVLLCVVVIFGRPTYADINASSLPHDRSIAVSHYIIDQYMDAYEAGETSVEVKVPLNDSDPSNFPFCDYGAQRIASNLWWHGMTKIKMEAVFAPDMSVNKMFGL